ncbi:MAG: STAS/SEC14 domain-containing protein [Rhodobiaceae bacterium]|nr:STAS/SEC14 domain-containing protein [Rhodobiaceae bacterium]MCC0060425.1 STAS/SEC14 domain-containing protein [Rhodobiaceae bacterium]
MFEKLPQSQDGVLGFKATGKLTDKDYQETLNPELERAFAEHGKVSVLILFEDFHGWELHAAWDDAALGFKHYNDFKRMALVDAPEYVAVAMRMFAPFFPGQVRSFSGNDADAAWAWVHGA